MTELSRDEGTETAATLSVPCAAFRLDDARCEAIIELARKTASDTSHALGA